MPKIKIGDGDLNKRLDVILSNELVDISRSRIQSLILEGCVKVNNETIGKKKIKLKLGDEIEVLIPEPIILDVEAENMPIEIVYEDDDVLVINKPSGMVVHPAIGNYTGTLVNAVMYHCGDKLSSINGVIRPGVVHRIDKDTSGLIMLAKNDKAHESLSKQLADHTVTREYWAIVFNNIKEDSFKIDTQIGRDERDRKKRAVNGTASKRAITNIEVLERFGNYTLIKAVLETGRTHQIRVHLAYLKHPLVGDVIYGPKKQVFNVDGQLLHAKTLGFVHPRTGEYMEFNSEIPESFQRILNKLRRDLNAKEKS
ncbi:MAG: RluA family pseudouridine synthase [Peptostreptococcaceae bacterium]|nr:RluA family pseudouridine synthase [Peptostreptococcaceae bacterium]